MTYDLVVRAAAEADMTEAVTWYERQQSGLGRALLAETEAVFRTIVERPESFPVDYRDMRRALVVRFPYVVHYLLLADSVIILAVLHEKQDKNRHLSERR